MRWLWLVILVICSLALAVPSSPNLLSLEIAKTFAYTGHAYGSRLLLNAVGTLAATYQENRLILWATKTGELLRDYRWADLLEDIDFVNDELNLVVVNRQDSLLNPPVSRQRIRISALGAIKSQALTLENTTPQLLGGGVLYSVEQDIWKKKLIQWISPDGQIIKFQNALDKSCNTPLAISANLKVIVQGTSLYSLETGKLIRHYDDVLGCPDSVALSPDGSRVAFQFSSSAKVSVWQDGNKIAIFRLFETQFNKIWFTDADTLQWNFIKDNQFQLGTLFSTNWSVLDGQKYSQRKMSVTPISYTPSPDFYRSIDAVAWSADGLGAFIRNDDSTLEYRNFTGQKTNFKSFSISDARLSPDGRLVAFYARNKQVRILETNSQKEIRSFSSQQYPDKLQWSGNNRWLIVGNKEVWDVKSGKIVYQRKWNGEFQATISGVIVTDVEEQSNQLLVLPLQELTSTRDASGNLETPALNDEFARARRIGTISKVKVDWKLAGDNVLRIARNDIRCFRLTDGKELWKTTNLPNTDIVINRNWLLQARENKLRLSSLENGKLQKTVQLNIPEDNSPPSIKALSPNGRFALGESTILDLETQRYLSLPILIKGNLEFSQDGRYLIEHTDQENAVLFWAMPNSAIIFR